MPKLSQMFRFAVLASTLTLLATISRAKNIIQTSEIKTQFTEKIVTVLVVGTSASHPDNALGNKQALVAAEMRKQMKAGGLQVFAIGIKQNEPDVSRTVADAIAKYSPTHTMSVTVPNGVVSVKIRTGESMTAASYVVKTEVHDAKSGAIVWVHTAQVEAGYFLGASNIEVATAIVTRMRTDAIF